MNDDYYNERTVGSNVSSQSRDHDEWLAENARDVDPGDSDTKQGTLVAARDGGEG